MTASSPRPAGSETTGELREESVDLTPGVVWTDAQLAVVRDLAARTHRAETALLRAAHVAAPDTTGGELRDVLERAIHAGIVQQWHGAMREDVALTDPRPIVRDLLAGPLRDLLAERDTLAAQVQAVEGLAEFYAERPLASAYSSESIARAIRHALGTPTTGGGE